LVRKMRSRRFRGGRDHRKGEQGRKRHAKAESEGEFSRGIDQFPREGLLINRAPRPQNKTITTKMVLIKGWNSRKEKRCASDPRKRREGEKARTWWEKFEIPKASARHAGLYFVKESSVSCQREAATNDCVHCRE